MVHFRKIESIEITRIATPEETVNMQAYRLKVMAFKRYKFRSLYSCSFLGGKKHLCPIYDSSINDLLQNSKTLNNLTISWIFGSLVFPLGSLVDRGVQNGTILRMLYCSKLQMKVIFIQGKWLTDISLENDGSPFNIVSQKHFIDLVKNL